jgi:hypothetical protein
MPVDHRRGPCDGSVAKEQHAAGLDPESDSAFFDSYVEGPKDRDRVPKLDPVHPKVRFVSRADLPGLPLAAIGSQQKSDVRAPVRRVQGLRLTHDDTSKQDRRHVASFAGRGPRERYRDLALAQEVPIHQSPDL